MILKIITDILYYTILYNVTTNLPISIGVMLPIRSLLLGNSDSVKNIINQSAGDFGLFMLRKI